VCLDRRRGVILTVAIVVLLAEYYVGVERPYTRVLKGAEYELFGERLLPRLPEEHEEFTLRHA
jgi:hypothetical protein